MQGSVLSGVMLLLPDNGERGDGAVCPVTPLAADGGVASGSDVSESTLAVSRLPEPLRLPPPNSRLPICGDTGRTAARLPFPLLLCESARRPSVRSRVLSSSSHDAPRRRKNPRRLLPLPLLARVGLEWSGEGGGEGVPSRLPSPTSTPTSSESGRCRWAFTVASAVPLSFPSLSPVL